MKSTSFTRTWVGVPALLLAVIVGLGLGTQAAGLFASPASSANTQTESAPVADPAPEQTAPSQVHERVIDGECELVDANGVPLYDSQFEQRTGSSPCNQH